MKKDDIERKIESEMTQKFKAASGNPKLAIHLAAVAGAFICALLPIGIDVWGLRTCEVIMIICIASLYGEKLTKAAARGILASGRPSSLALSTQARTITAAIGYAPPTSSLAITCKRRQAESRSPPERILAR